MDLSEAILSKDFDSYMKIKNEMIKNNQVLEINHNSVWTFALSNLPTYTFLNWLNDSAFDDCKMDNSTLCSASHLPLNVFLQFYNSSQCPHNLSSMAFINAIKHHCKIYELNILYELGFNILDEKTVELMNNASNYSDDIINYYSWVNEHIKSTWSSNKEEIINNHNISKENIVSCNL